MKVRFWGKFTLFVAIVTFPQFLTATSPSIICFSSSGRHSALQGQSLLPLVFPSQAAEIEKIGKQGQDGQPGEKGQDGRNSDSLTVFADGSPMTLDLAGENGHPGTNGSPGANANCQEQPKDFNRNLQGANGGNGGDGGDGGNGGNGGSLTVYTTNKEHLKQIFIIASGGEGGEPGQGGEAGQGCKCSHPSWNQPTCSGEPGSDDYNCTTREFKCQEGYDGQSGRNGRKGRVGRLGTLTLINLDKSLAPDQPTATMAIADLKDRGFTLSKNIWETHDNATALFAPGSIISDRYQELVARHEHTVLLVWDAPQPVDDFADSKITLSLKGANDAEISTPEDLWLESTSSKQNNITEFFVFNAVRAKDATRLKSEGLSGQGANLQLNLVDKASQSDVVSTDFSVKYRVSNSDDGGLFRRSFDYRTKFEGKIPPQLISQQGDNFTIKLGQLPIPQEFLEPGVQVEVQLIANRSLAGNSKQQELIIRHEIKD
jgi:hypothetical protein